MQLLNPRRSDGLPQQPATQAAPVIKQAPSLGRILTMVAFALSCFGILVFLWLSFGGSVRSSRRATGGGVLPGGHAARQGGRGAHLGGEGRAVKTTDPNKQTGLTDTVLEIDARYAPLPKDTHAILRQKTLLGETYVELSPGAAGAGQRRREKMVPDGGHLAEGKVVGDGRARRDPARLRPGHAPALQHLARSAGAGGARAGGRDQQRAGAAHSVRRQHRRRPEGAARAVRRHARVRARHGRGLRRAAASARASCAA